MAFPILYLVTKQEFRKVKSSHIHENKENMAGTPKTRKKKTLGKRISVLKELDGGKSCRQVPGELGVGKTQIQSIRKRKREIQDDFENNPHRIEKGGACFFHMMTLMN